MTEANFVQSMEHGALGNMTSCISCRMRHVIIRHTELSAIAYCCLLPSLLAQNAALPVLKTHWVWSLAAACLKMLSKELP